MTSPPRRRRSARGRRPAAKGRWPDLSSGRAKACDGLLIADARAGPAPASRAWRHQAACERRRSGAASLDDAPCERVRRIRSMIAAVTSPAASRVTTPPRRARKSGATARRDLKDGPAIPRPQGRGRWGGVVRQTTSSIAVCVERTSSARRSAGRGRLWCNCRTRTACPSPSRAKPRRRYQHGISRREQHRARVRAAYRRACSTPRRTRLHNCWTTAPAAQGLDRKRRRDEEHPPRGNARHPATRPL